MSSFRIDFDYKEVIGMYMILDRLGKSPQKALNKGTSKAAQVVKRTIKAGTPHVSGVLRKSIATKTERSSKKGKKVREITIKGGADANASLQKPIKHPGVLGGKSPYAYYPNSVEFGFLARAPGGSTIYVKFLSEDYETRKGTRTRHRIYYEDTGMRVPSQKVEGQHYMREGGETASEPAKKAMIETMTKEMDKIWKGG